MSIFHAIKHLFRPRRPRTFSMGKRGGPGIPGAREDIVDGKHLERPPYATQEAKEAARTVWSGRRKDERAKIQKEEDMDPPQRTPFGGMSAEVRATLSKDLTPDLETNLKTVRGVFHSPRNSDLAIREFEMQKKGGLVKAAVAFIPSMISEVEARSGFLDRLIGTNALKEVKNVTVEILNSSVVIGGETHFAYNFSNVVQDLIEGHILVFVDGDTVALAGSIRVAVHRPIQESPTEAVVRGPHEGFVEDVRTNISLIRKMLNTPQLITENYPTGGRGHTLHSVMYIEGIANPKLVDEVRKRVTNIKTSTASPNAVLTDYLKDHPWDPFPQFIATERPDNVANMLSEGYVALLNDAPGVLLMPANIWSLMQSSEDYYIGPVPATLLRCVRWLSLFVTWYASALFVAVTTFHSEMIPTDLLFSIASAREGVPLPTFVEVLIMETAFEVIREGGIRIPQVIGPTIGIVGAVILGQAAVQANIVSPILVVVVALSSLGSFAIPNYELGLWARIMKFPMIFSAALLGIPGLTLATIILVTRLTSLRSFGVPVLAPIVPYFKHSRDVVLRGPLSDMAQMPMHTRPLDDKRRAKRRKGNSGGKLR